MMLESDELQEGSQKSKKCSVNGVFNKGEIVWLLSCDPDMYCNANTQQTGLDT